MTPREIKELKFFIATKVMKWRQVKKHDMLDRADRFVMTADGVFYIHVKGNEIRIWDPVERADDALAVQEITVRKMRDREMKIWAGATTDNIFIGFKNLEKGEYCGAQSFKRVICIFAKVVFSE